MLRVPAPAPKRCSAAAAAVASFSSTAGRSNACSRERDDRHVVPARQVGRRDQHAARRVERAAAADADHLDLAPATPDSSTALRPSSNSRAQAVVGAELSVGSGRRRRSGRAPAGSTTPAASFVPPMSSASTEPRTARVRRGRRLRPRSRPSALAPLGRDSFDEVALPEEEDDDHREGGEHRARDDHLVVAAGRPPTGRTDRAAS